MSSGAINILKNNENIIFILNPSITYFKSVYRKHTKFTISYKEEQVPNSDFKGNNFISIDLNHYADLLCDISLKVSIDSPNNNLKCKLKSNLPLHLVNDITLRMIGPGIELDKLDKDYINFHAMLNNPKSFNSTYNYDSSTKSLTCKNGNNFQNMSLCGGVIYNGSELHSFEVINKMTSIIPLPFAFSKSIGNAIPLCALNNTHTKAQIIISCIEKTNPAKFLGTETTNDNVIELFKYSIISKYIFLSDKEKLRFKNSKQEYLYERVNVLNTGATITEQDYRNSIPINRLGSNNPIKQIYLYNTSPDHNKFKYNIIINNEQMFSDSFNHEFFSKVEILNKFKGCIYNSINGSNTVVDNYIALIDFSLKTSEGPSGCINPNTNTIDLKLNIDDISSYSIKIYIVCYYLLSISNENINYMFE